MFIKVRLTQQFIRLQIDGMKLWRTVEFPSLFLAVSRSSPHLQYLYICQDWRNWLTSTCSSANAMDVSNGAWRKSFTISHNHSVRWYTHASLRMNVSCSTNSHLKSNNQILHYVAPKCNINKDLYVWQTVLQQKRTSRGHHHEMQNKHFHSYLSNWQIDIYINNFSLE